jgi:hypothetical protein
VGFTVGMLLFAVLLQGAVVWCVAPALGHVRLWAPPSVAHHESGAPQWKVLVPPPAG